MHIGPFAYLRPEADIRDGAKIGTFVEVKNSDIGAGAKVPAPVLHRRRRHRRGRNIGAGTITANYHRKAQEPHDDREGREDGRRHDRSSLLSTSATVRTLALGR